MVRRTAVEMHITCLKASNFRVLLSNYTLDQCRTTCSVNAILCGGMDVYWNECFGSLEYFLTTTASGLSLKFHIIIICFSETCNFTVSFAILENIQLHYNLENAGVLSVMGNEINFFFSFLYFLILFDYTTIDFAPGINKTCEKTPIMFFFLQITLDSLIPCHMPFVKANAIFHHWMIGTQRMGLAFNGTADARSFDRGIRVALENLDKGMYCDDTA